MTQMTAGSRPKPRLAVVLDGRMVHVRVRRSFVEALVFASATPESTEEPIGEWELPLQLRYSLNQAAMIANAQTDGAKR